MVKENVNHNNHSPISKSRGSSSKKKSKSPILNKSKLVTRDEQAGSCIFNEDKKKKA